MDKENRNRILKQSGKGIGMSLGIYAAVLLFGLSIIHIGVLLSAFSIIMYAWKAYKKERQPEKDLIKSLCTLWIVLCIIGTLQYFVGGWGFLGLIIIVLVLSTIIILKRRKDFIKAIEDIETQIWGKPLTQHSKQELKAKRIKIKLR